jgi:hypothetical protein
MTILPTTAEAGLKACPWCNVAPAVEAHMARQGREQVPTAFVTCPVCKIHRGMIGMAYESLEETTADAVELWNRRVPSEAEGLLREVVEAWEKLLAGRVVAWAASERVDKVEDTRRFGDVGDAMAKARGFLGRGGG